MAMAIMYTLCRCLLWVQSTKLMDSHQNWINFKRIFGEGQLIQEMRDINLISIHHIPNTFLLMRLFFAITVYLDYKITYVHLFFFFLALCICWVDWAPVCVEILKISRSAMSSLCSHLRREMYLNEPFVILGIQVFLSSKQP